MNLTSAHIEVANNSASTCHQAQILLREEVSGRAQQLWSNGTEGPVILLHDNNSSNRDSHGSPRQREQSSQTVGFNKRPEGFCIDRDGLNLIVTGNDSRGVLYGVGWLIRHLEIRRSSVLLPDSLLSSGSYRSAPVYSLRGHQIGYRPKTNSYAGWTVVEWEQYIRDLIIFGANAIEIIPPKSDDLRDSDHFPLPPLDMMTKVSTIAELYDLDLWIWFPALEDDYRNKSTLQRAMAEWRLIFSNLPRIDAIFVPGGDPGTTPAKILLDVAMKQKQSLREFHPDGQIWVSPQGFYGDDENDFYSTLEQGLDWLDGVVFGPWVHLTPEAFRNRVPEHYPVRLYPDITHCWSCQYPVPNWDPALAACQGREPINPRPVDQARIIELSAPYSVGALTYSEGNNDDVNKMMWSALLWNPDHSIGDLLRQYGRVFVHPDLADGVASGILALEENWRGPLLSNSVVGTTFLRFQAMEKAAPIRVLKSWRFLQLLYRAYSDAYIRERLIIETAGQTEALGELRRAPSIGAKTACNRAATILENTASATLRGELHGRVYALAEALFQNIHMKLSVKRYGAQNIHRGASLDGIEYPLNDRFWLMAQMGEINELADEQERLQRIETMLCRTDPGPGGYYDNLGDPSQQAHLISGPGFYDDPSFLNSALRGFLIPHPPQPIPYAWISHSESIGSCPLSLRYEGLEAKTLYRVVVVYLELIGPTSLHLSRVRMNAISDTRQIFKIHDWIKKPQPSYPLQFDLPCEATQDGSVTLEILHEDISGHGRGAIISEIWLQRSDRFALQISPPERR